MKDLMHTNCHCERVFEHVSNLFISNDHSVFYTSAWVHMYGCLSICLRGVWLSFYICMCGVCLYSSTGPASVYMHCVSCDELLRYTIHKVYVELYFNQCLTVTHASPLKNCHIFWPSTINYVTLAN